MKEGNGGRRQEKEKQGQRVGCFEGEERRKKKRKGGKDMVVLME